MYLVDVAIFGAIIGGVGPAGWLAGLVAAYTVNKGLDAAVSNFGVMSVAKEVAGDDWPED